MMMTIVMIMAIQAPTSKVIMMKVEYCNNIRLPVMIVRVMRTRIVMTMMMGVEMMIIRRITVMDNDGVHVTVVEEERKIVEQ